MITRIPIFLMQLLAMLILSITLVSCVDTMPYRATISPNKVVKEPEPCRENQITLPTKDGASFTCEDIPVRPNNTVRFKDDFCICKDGKALSYGNCASFCVGRSPGEETFYANFTVGPEVSLTSLGNLHGWCTAQMPHTTNPVMPQCKLEFKDDSGNAVYADADPPKGSNSVTSVLAGLAQDRTYVVTLIAMEDGPVARSNSIQLVKFSQDVSFPTLGPLKNAPITQYSCIYRTHELNEYEDPLWTHAYRLHFYFLPRIPPMAVPASNSNLFCHDIFEHGLTDDESYLRLEQKPGVFNLWDVTDPRFYDTNNNTIIDVTEIIVQKTKHFGGGNIPTNTRFFIPFRWPGSPAVSKQAGNDNAAQTLGNYMSPWIDRSTYKSYCLNDSHYNSDVPLFRAMRDVIGVQTEGLYVGVKAPENITNQQGQSVQGPEDYMLIRESDLKRVWFYLNNGVPTAPTETNVANVQPYFYYPLNFQSPFIMSSNQRRYRVRGASELNGVESGGASADGSASDIPPHDRKLGCIPKF